MITCRAASTIGLLAVAGALMTAAAVPVTAAVEAPAAKPVPTSPSCHLGNGVKHVINITFDNVHFFRENPNVPSDLEQMPTLIKFLQRKGAVLSNMHTPLIAHTAEDSLPIYSGLYGDRHGEPVSNTTRATGAANGTTEPETSFTYWTSPVINNSTKTPSTENHDPSMVYSPTVPRRATVRRPKIAPEPWVAFNKAGCSVGAFSTANMVLENNGDIPTVFGLRRRRRRPTSTAPAPSSVRLCTAAKATPPATSRRAVTTPSSRQQPRHENVQGPLRAQVSSTDCDRAGRRRRTGSQTAPAISLISTTGRSPTSKARRLPRLQPYSVTKPRWR